MDRSFVQQDLLATDITEVSGMPAIAHVAGAERVTGLVHAVQADRARVLLRDPATGALNPVPFERLRCLIVPGFVTTEQRRRLVTLLAALGLAPSDEVRLTCNDGQAFTFGASFVRREAIGLQLYQFTRDGRITRMFFPDASLARVVASDETERAREMLWAAATHVVASAAELRTCLDHCGDLVAGTGRPAPPRQVLAEILVREHLVSEQQIHEALDLRSRTSGKHTGEILLELGAIAEDDLYACLSEVFRVPHVKLHHFDFEPQALESIRPAVARKARAVPLIVHREALVVALNDPTDREAIQMLRFATDRTVLPVLATQRDIEAALDGRYARTDHAGMLAQLESLGGALPAGAAAEASLESASDDEPIVKLVANLLREAIQRRASDIHLRPAEDHLDLLYRIDGTLVPAVSFPKNVHAPLVGRVKIMGGMDIAEKRLPQDGQIRFAMDEATIDLRVSIMPTIVGESVVIRVLNTKAGLKPVEGLGFSPEDLAAVKGMLDRSYGLVLVTGPTGSGKSTTLYSFLNELVARNLNIITVEDPVEYRIEGIEQVQARTDIGYTFAAALRQILRHDPDAILVGEIRDQETAEITVKSALTGHIVLSTLHTNNAVGAITRLRDIGIVPYLLSSTLLGVLAQRLIRTNCLGCMEAEPVDPAMRRQMGVGEHELFMKGHGCDECNGTGYRGRTPVYELLRVTPAMAELVSAGAPVDALQRQALADGMRPLTRHAIDLARDFKTSLAEAYRVRLD